MSRLAILERNRVKNIDRKSWPLCAKTVDTIAEIPSLIGPDDYSLLIDPVKGDRSVFKKIRQFFDLGSEFLIFFFITQKLFVKLSIIFHAVSAVI